MENRERKVRKKNVIFHCLVGLKNERKENGVDEIFHPSPPIYSFQIRNKREMKMILKEKYKITTIFSFFFSIFNSRDIIVISFSSPLPNIYSEKHKYFFYHPD